MRVRELIVELGPRIDVDQHVGEINFGQPARDLGGQGAGRLRSLEAGQSAHVQLPAIKVDADLAAGQDPVECRDALTDVGAELGSA